MKVLYRKKEMSNINTIAELEHFVKKHELVNFFRKFPESMHQVILEFIDKRKSIGYKELKMTFLRKLINEKSHWSINFWTKRGYDIEEAEQKVKELQEQNSKKMLECAKNNPQKYKKTKSTCIEYWLNKTGGDYEKAKNLLSKRQATFSLKKCKEKYGESKGFRVWEKRQKKWIKTLSQKTKDEIKEIRKKQCHTKENMIKRHGKENGIIAWENYLKAHRKMYKASSWSLDIIQSIEEHCFNNNINLDFKYDYSGNSEHFILSASSIYFYDFTIKDIGIIFEFNGEHVHPNKEKLSINEWRKWEHPWTKQKADEIYEYDKKKETIANECGFKVYNFWYSEPTATTLNKCINIIEKQIK